MHKKLQEFHKKFARFKKLTPQMKKAEDLNAKVLEDAGDLLNELHYITKKNIKKKNYD